MKIKPINYSKTNNSLIPEGDFGNGDLIIYMLSGTRSIDEGVRYLNHVGTNMVVFHCSGT